VPVAILGSEEFDVGEIDKTVIAFVPNFTPPASIAGVPSMDLNADGFSDLVRHFRTSESGVELGDTELGIKGELTDGTRFSAATRFSRIPADRRHS
jgi:hypothetical protein